MPDRLEITYLPAIGLNADGEVDFFWSDDPRELNLIDTVIIHAMCNPYKEGEERYSAVACRDLLNSLGVSCHYFIDRLGAIFQTVDEVRQALHAGLSKMPAPDNRRERNSVNAFSVGIELFAEPNGEFTPAQYDSLVALVVQIMTRLPIENILGHSDVATAEVRPEPKTDPGENFDWRRFLGGLEEYLGSEKFGELKLVGGNTR